MMQREYVVRYQRLAGYLMQRGFVLLDLRKNPNMPHRNVFIFRDSPQLRDALSDYKAAIVG